MKLSLIFVLALSIAGCSTAEHFSQQQLFALSNGQFQVNSIKSDLAGAMTRLGPPDVTLVIITPCPDLEFATVVRVVNTVKHAGYNHVGFAPPESADLALCQGDVGKSVPQRNKP